MEPWKTLLEKVKQLRRIVCEMYTLDTEDQLFGLSDVAGEIRSCRYAIEEKLEDGAAQALAHKAAEGGDDASNTD